MSNETALMEQPPTRAVAAIGGRGIELTNMDELVRFSAAVIKSGLAPKGLERPEAVFVAVQLGLELGLTPMAALQNIASINGRPSIYGDAALALVRSSGLLESYQEEQIGERGKDTWGYRVTSKRVNGGKQVEEFTVEDAKLAQLWGKTGPWQQYPARMLKFRARGYNLRDNFGDVLKGLRTVEEARDIPDEDEVDIMVVTEPEPEPEDDKPVPPPSKPVPLEVVNKKGKEPKSTVQNELASIVTDAGFSFEQFRDFVGGLGMVKDAASYGDWSELPKDVASRCINASTGLIKQMESASEGGKL